MNEKLAENLLAHQEKLDASLATNALVNGITLALVLLMLVIAFLIFRKVDDLCSRRRGS